MKKRLCYLAAAIMLCMVMFTVAVSAAEELDGGVCGSGVTWTLYDDGELVIEGTGAMSSYTSTTLPWKSYSSFITKATVKDGVTSVGDYAFYGCSKLTSVSLPDGVTAIGNYAFHQCTGVTSVHMGSNVKTIGNNAFYNCDGLTSVTIPEGAETVGSYAFYDCDGLTSITIPDSVTTLGERAFEGCGGLETAVIGNGVTKLDYDTFADCTRLEEVVIGSGMEKIEYNAFADCSKLTVMTIYSKNVVLPVNYSHIFATNVTTFYGYIGSTTESYANSRTNSVFVALDENVDYPSIRSEGTCGTNLNYILYSDGELIISGTGAMKDYTWDLKEGSYIPGYGYDLVEVYSSPLADNEHIKKITILDGVTTIGVYAFANCDNLTSVTIPDSVVSIGANAFFSCGSMTSVTMGDGVTSIGADAFSFCTALPEVNLGEGVTSIADNAFKNCTGLTEFHITAGVVTIGTDTFYDCKNLAKFTVDDGNPVFSADEDGVLYNKKKTTLVKYPAGNTQTDYAIADSVRIISDSAFRGCVNLETVTIPANAFSIGTYAFADCGSLTDVTIYSTTVTISANAFKGNITLRGYSGSTAEAYANKYSSILFVDLEAEDTRPTLLTGTCGDAVNFTLYNDGELFIEGTGNMADWNSFSSVPWYSYIGKITKITICDGVTSVGKYAFGVKTINSETNLTSVTIPDSVVSIGEAAFYLCRKLNDLTVGSGVTSIGESAFYYCTALASVTIPDGVTTIGDSAFYNCSALTDVTIGDSVASIGSCAFERCTGLTDVTILSRDVQFGTYVFYNTSSALVLSGYADSTAETYALKNNHAFTKLTDYTCGEDLTWSLSEDGVLTISGTGAMKTYASAAKQPWYNFAANITAVVMEEGVTSVGAYAFSNCTALASVTFPEGMTSIEPYAFNQCTGLKKANLPDSVTSIGAYSFYKCSALAELTLSSALTSVDTFAFYGCSSLKKVVIPEDVTEIGKYAFSKCAKLTDVTVLSENATLGTGAFAGNAALVITGYTGSTAETYAANNSYKFVALDVPETEAPETEAPETEAPETEAPETEAPETEAPETEAPETEAPETDAPEAVFTLHDSYGNPGDTIEIELTIDSTAPINSIALYELTYDAEVLTFEGFADYEDIEAKCDFAGGFDSTDRIITLPLTEDEALTGKICTLVFTVNEGAATGETTVEMKSIVKRNHTEIASSVVGATVMISPRVYGDVDGDGYVDIIDVRQLFKHSMLPEIYPVDYPFPMDLNGDGTVDLEDARILFKYSMLPEIYPIR